MSTNNESKIENTSIDIESYEQISSFLKPKKRRATIDILNNKGELTQNELAHAINSTPTSLSNILHKFEKFEYKLLDVKSMGKYRVYRLSDLGNEYIKYIDEKANQINNRDNISIKEDQELFQSAEKIIKALKTEFDDAWQTRFDDALVKLVKGSGMVLDEKSEMFASQYLECLEQLTLQDNYIMLNKVLDLLPNPILRNRVEDFMEYFDRFIPIFKSLQSKGQAFEVGKIIEAAFSNSEEPLVAEHLKAVGWKNNEYYRLKEVIPNIKRCIAGYSEKEIYKYLNGLLLNQEMLSYYIMKYLCDSI